MKILHIVPSYFPAKKHGGPIESVHNLNKWLVRRGIDVTVYTTNINGKNGRIDVPLGKEVVLDGVKVFYFPITFASWEYSRDLRSALRRLSHEFDLVHITSVFLSASTIGARCAKKLGVPYIISPRGSLMKEPLAMKNAFLKKAYISLIEKRNLAGAAAIHFTTEREKEEYESAGLPIRQGVIIPNSFDSEGFEESIQRGIIRKRFGISENAPVVLFLSRISWKKGLDTLISAFAEVARKLPEARLLIAGGDDEGYRRNIELLITNYELQNKVIFAGMLTGADRIAAYRDADVFVLPSYSENFGMAVVEALAMELPSVITEGIAISSLIKERNAGIVVRKNKDEVSAAIVDVLKHKGKFRSMVEKGKKLVEEEFSPEAVAGRFEEAYKEIIKA